ncbi:hypothetical protein H8E88_13970 [candidate division KSB1 bacterium]|nr:hypothetical protein [candidate division KSB1 bacterium]MBL7093815.1 hypothetical protein [candidate division KSB1 bacterium]
MGRDGEEVINLIGYFSAFIFSQSPIHEFSHSFLTTCQGIEATMFLNSSSVKARMVSHSMPPEENASKANLTDEILFTAELFN